MNLDAVLCKGRDDKPAVIFIHGLGMDKNIWVNPSDSYILGGKFPIKTILGKQPFAKDFGLSRDMTNEKVPKFSTGEHSGNIQTLFDDLRFKGYTVFTWSQKRPAGPIESVELELKQIVRNVKKMTKAGIIIIGHSRGGLIGRKYLLKKDRKIRGLITISTPHKGSSIARIANYLSPLVSLINPFFTDSDKGNLSFAIKRVLEFLKSKALKELLPGSNFFKSLKDRPSEGVHYISVGGTNPTLFRFYRWKWNPVKEGEFQRWFLMPDELFSIPDIFEKVMPENLYPEEMKKGKGDGLVTAESSKIPWCNEHYNFDLNHAGILFDEGVRNTLLKVIERIS
jgi:pimeloyl-ACP methyl ester carboxylesterase